MSVTFTETIPNSIYLGGVSLSGYRSFAEDTELDFCNEAGVPAQWTIVLGDNGTSKTGVLQAIAAVVPKYDETAVLPESVQDKNREVDRLPGAWVPRCADGSQFLSWWLRNCSGRETAPTPDPKKISVNLRFCPSEEGREEARVEEESQYSGITPGFDWGAELEFSVNQADERLAVQNRYMHSGGQGFREFYFFTYSANRLVADTKGNSPYHRQGHSLFAGYDAIDSPEQWLKELDHAVRLEDKPPKKVAAKRTFESAVRCIKSILPDVEDVRVKKIAINPYGVPTGVRAQFKCPCGWVFFEDLGLGYQSIAAWVIDLLKNMHEIYVDREHPQEGAAVVLVDEIDLHLHPKWQMTLISRLGSIFKNTQFIVTSHSPLVVQAAGPDSNIILFKSVQDEEGQARVVVDSDPVRVRGWRIDQIVSSDLFGLSSARPAEFEELFEERSKLVANPNRSRTQNERLLEITERIERDAPPSVNSEANELVSQLLKSANSTK